MRIARESETADFYESFSDLIFGTLIIFLVTVLALMLRVRETTAKLDQQTESIVADNRFTGASGSTRFDFAVLPSEITGRGETTVVIFPAAVSQKWSLERAPGVSDPVLDVCRLYRENALLMLTASEFVAMAGGLTPEATMPDLATCPAVHYHTMGDIVYRLYLLDRRNPGAKSWTPERMRDAIGGPYLHAEFEADRRRTPHRTEFDADSRSYDAWMTGLDRAQNEIIGPFNAASQAFASNPPAGIRLSVIDENRVRIGRSTLSVQQVRLLLGALLPGRSFIIEHLDGRDQKPLAAPAWFERDVLFPAGYDGRVLKVNELPPRDEPVPR